MRECYAAMRLRLRTEAARTASTRSAMSIYYISVRSGRTDSCSSHVVHIRTLEMCQWHCDGLHANVGNTVVGSPHLFVAWKQKRPANLFPIRAHSDQLTFSNTITHKTWKQMNAYFSIVDILSSIRSPTFGRVSIAHNAEFTRRTAGHPFAGIACKENRCEMV